MARRALSSDLIELDLNRYELRRAGKRISVERIPMELLILLAQSGGRLLSREEIIEHLWGKNPWLDAERNLNTAIGKLRRALGDSADQPRFIETVIGKGYRFVVPDPQTNGTDPSSYNGDVRFKLLSAPLTEQPAKFAPELIVPEPVEQAPDLVSEDQPVVSAAPALEISRPRGTSLLRFCSRWRILLAGGAAFIMGFLMLSFRPRPRPVIAQYERITSGDVEKDFTLGEFPLPIMTDSLRLYFPMHNLSGELAIGQVAAVGGESGEIKTSLPSPVALDISPNGSSLLIASPAALPEAPLWVLPIPYGQPMRLGHIEAQSASWSPDSSRIAYSANTGLFTVRSDGTDVRQLVRIDPETGRQIYWPRWSPDASRLRYSVYDPKTGYHSLWQVKADGTGARPVLPGWSSAPDECCGSWTPDGQFFVFAAIKKGRSDIWSISESTGLFSRVSHRPFQLTAGPISFSSPLLAHDGTIFAAGTETRGELARWNPESRTLTPWFGGASVVGACSSRDGKWITYISFPDRTLWRSRVDGSEKLQLTIAPTEAYLPRWSPDGRQIAFYARTPGNPFQIYIISADGGTPHRPMPSNQQQIDPTWSKDGRQLMFESDPWQERGSGRETQIEIVDLQTGEYNVVPGSAGLVSPRWSPDGRFVAAMPADSSGLMLLDLETQKWTELLHAQVGYPNWSHDSKYIYFDWFSASAGVRRIRLADREVLPVLSREPGDELWTSDDWTGLTAEDSVLLLRNVSFQEVYAIRWHGR